MILYSNTSINVDMQRTDMATECYKNRDCTWLMASLHMDLPWIVFQLYHHVVQHRHSFTAPDAPELVEPVEPDVMR